MMFKSEVVLTTQREDILENASSTWIAINEWNLIYGVLPVDSDLCTNYKSNSILYFLQTPES